MSSPPAPLLTVITVTYNDIDGVSGTLDSLRHLLTSGLVESIVIDGGTDAQLIQELRSRYPDSLIVSEPDDGLYDAMNKGIAMARGKFLWFLNGGDMCEIGPDQLLRIVSDTAPDYLLYFGYILDFNNGTVVNRRSRHPLYLWHALPTSHQAILYGNKAISAHRYDPSYPVSADYEFTLKVAKGAGGVSTQRVAVARFVVGGTSTVNAPQIALDAARAQHSAGAPRSWSLVSTGLHRLSAFARRVRSM
ncbi:MAG: hypothetical protein DSY74_04905 [Actinobacteria bacterium]|nr:MAG: hypothetical protein DSY74_04905 [Actinomycetota bacterium]